MSGATPIFPEARAIVRALEAMDRGAHAEALGLIRRALAVRQAPRRGPDTRPTSVLWLRAHLEQAKVELEHRQPVLARKALQRGLEGEHPATETQTAR